MTNKSCLLVRVSIAIRMEGRRVKEIPETDKQVEKGTSGSQNVQKIMLLGELEDEEGKISINDTIIMQGMRSVWKLCLGWLQSQGGQKQRR